MGQAVGHLRAPPRSIACVAMDGSDPHMLKALLDWQAELGADEPIGDTPVDCYALPDKLGKPDMPTPEVKSASAPAVVHADKPDAGRFIGAARAAAEGAADLAALKAAVEAFEGCELKRGAKTTVFADGNPAAQVMVIGEAPGRDEDAAGLPFVGAAGRLLDKMFAAIGMARDGEAADNSLYITNVLPWRPPQNRTPTPEEIAMLKPFLERHVALADPDILVIMGNVACSAILGRTGVTRLRGKWDQAMDRPALPMFHPAYLLRTPAAKREAWADLLSLQSRVRG